MRVGIYSQDSLNGYYSKVDGLIYAAKIKGLDYERWQPRNEYDVVINWEPFDSVKTGNLLTVGWTWDTHRAGLLQHQGSFDILFRAHATFFHEHDLDYRKVPTYWMPPAVDTEFFKRENAKIKYDLVFIGGERGNDAKNRQLAILKDNFLFKHINEKLNKDDYVKAMSESRIIVNLPIAGETNKRVTEALSVGPALMPWGNDYSVYLSPYKHYIEFPEIAETPRSKDEEKVVKDFVEKVEFLLDNQGLLDSRAYVGRELVERHFSFNNQVDRIERILKIHEV